MALTTGKAWTTSPTALRRTMQIRGLEESFIVLEKVGAKGRRPLFRTIVASRGVLISVGSGGAGFDLLCLRLGVTELRLRWRRHPGDRLAVGIQRGEDCAHSYRGDGSAAGRRFEIVFEWLRMLEHGQGQTVWWIKKWQDSCSLEYRW